MKNILTIGKKSKLAFENLKKVSHRRINSTLDDYIKLILKNKKKIIIENNKDVKTLKRTNSKVKNQLGKLTNTPTLRWIFQCFQVVHLLRINQSPKVVNLTEERSLILEFLPSSCQKYYLGNNNKKR